MKKLVAIILALILGLSCSISFAEGIDLKAMSDDQLLELYASVEDELVERDILHEHLYVGDYIAGEDLEPGKYVLSVVEAYESSRGSVYIEYQVWDYDEEAGEWKRIVAEDLYHAGEKGSFTLKEGQKLCICNGEFEIISFKKAK